MNIAKEKFIVINRKYLTAKGIPQHLSDRLQDALEDFMTYLPDNKYYVCNQEEPYAQEVIDLILKGEGAKEDL